jgi:hypothetical protein
MVNNARGGSDVSGDRELQCSAEELAVAVIASLRATARSIYTSARLAADTRGVKPNIEQRRAWISAAYDEVMAMLPEGSPFRRPLQQFREADTADPRETISMN